jgi:ABC-type multidrug transport system fused ATPase/permease subunit
MKLKKINIKKFCDFEQLPEGDETIVNSTSASISEGQKIRISLDRC